MIRLIGADGEQLGVVPPQHGRNLANQAGLDLVEIAPTATPPVCKILDLGKYLYLEKQKQKENRKNQKSVVWKEIRLEPNISDHDLTTKAHAGEKFLKEGDKLLIKVRFKGRWMAHPELGRKLLIALAGKLEEFGQVEAQPLLEGRQMSMVMVPKGTKTAPIKKPAGTGANGTVPAPLTPPLPQATTHVQPAAPIAPPPSA